MKAQSIIGNEPISLSNNPTPLEKTIFAPDFAFPADVRATAQAFLKAHPASDDAKVGGERLLAAQEDAVATLDIDSRQINQAVEGLLKIAEIEPNKATRAMFYAYAALLCHNNAYYAHNGYLSTPDPSKIDEWGNQAFELASDSLYRLALETAPKDAPLSDYAAALTDIDRQKCMLKTVRQFIFFTACSNNDYLDSDSFDITDFAPVDSPLWFFVKTYRLKKIDEQVAFLRENLQNPNVGYGVMSLILDRSILYGDGYKLLLEFSKTNYPQWMEPIVEDIIRCLNSGTWNMLVRRGRYANIPFNIIFSTQNTDSLDFRIYRIKTAEEITPAKLVSALEKRDLKVKFNSGDTMQYDTVQYTLPAGYYYIETDYRGQKYSTIFCVAPWMFFSADYEPGKQFIQVLDPTTGKGVKGVKASLKLDSKSNKSYSVTTNNDGYAVLTKPHDPYISLVDPATGMIFKEFLPSYHLTYKEDKEDSKTIRITGTTDLPVYHPGDTVKWEAVAYNQLSTVENYSTIAEVHLQKDRNEKQKIAMFKTAPTDRFGRTHGTFDIPADAVPGSGHIKINDNFIYFRVSDFKLPDLSIKDTKYAFVGDSVMISGYVFNRAGAPRSDTDVKLTLHGDCDSLFTFNTVTDNNGRFEFTVQRQIAADPEDFEDPDVDSRTFFVVEASTPDGYNVSYDDSYFTFADVNLTLDTEPDYNLSEGITFSVDYKLYGREDYDKPVMCHWELLKKVKGEYYSPYLEVFEGDAPCGEILIPKAMTETLSPGTYKIIVTPTGIIGDETSELISLYNPDLPVLPVDAPIWIPNEKSFPEKGKVKFLVGAAESETILWTLTAGEVPSESCPLKPLKLKKGYQTIELNVNTAKKLFLWSARDGFNHEYSINMPKIADPDTLSLSLESFREKTVSGEQEHWTFVTRRAGKPVSAAVSVNVYDQRIYTLFGAPSSCTFHTYKPSIYFGARFYDIANSGNNLNVTYSGGRFFVPSWLRGSLFPGWKYGQYYYPFEQVKMRAVNQIYGVGATSPQLSGQVAGLSISSDSNVLYEVETVEDLADFEVQGYGTVRKATYLVADKTESALSADMVSIRAGRLYNALWKPMLTTDAATGAVNLDFNVPEQTATWRLSAYAWTTDLKSKGLWKTFVASKPVYISTNMPRFVRVGDRVDMVTAITNDSDQPQTISYDSNFGAETMTGVIDIEPRSTRYVTTVIPIDGAIALNDSLSLTFRATNGKYGDGERITVPILPSSALVVESEPFYLNPSDKIFRANLPENPEASDKTELHFTANPMWTIVESLPPVLDELEDMRPLSTYSAQALYAATTARKIAENHPIVAQVIDLKKAREMERKAFDALKSMQQPDGGFPWGSWARSSSLGNTLVVLSWFDQDFDNPKYRNFIEKALDFVDNNIVPKGGKPGTDLNYAVIRGAYGKPSTLAGQSVIANTVNHALKNWKSYSLGNKCLAAILLLRNGHTAVAKEILRSVSQYGVITPDRGMVFPNMPGIVSYANMLEAFYTLDPASPVVDAVRQALVCQRRGCSWGNTGHTAYAVRAMVNSGTDWVIPAENVSVSVDGQPVALPDATGMRGAFSVEIKGDSVTVERSGHTPAYGAIVTRRSVPLAAVEAFGSKQLSITKTIYALSNDGKGRIPVEQTELKPGQRVVVSFRLHADADMTDIIVQDDRSAALEPVDQMGRYKRGERCWYFVQNTSSETDIYIDYLGRGYTTVEYDAIINNSGNFTTGVATVTCGQDPDLTAHSASFPFSVSPR